MPKISDNCEVTGVMVHDGNGNDTDGEGNDTVCTNFLPLGRDYKIGQSGKNYT